MAKKIKKRKNSQDKQSQEQHINEALAVAIGHHQAGRLQEAESIYNQILMTNPDHPDVLHLTGLLAHNARNYAAALKLIAKAINADPSQAHYYYNMGAITHELGRLDDAVHYYKSAVTLKPDYHEALENMGMAHISMNRLDEALSCFEKTLLINPQAVRSRKGVVYILGHSRSMTFKPELYTKLKELYSLPGVKYQDLALATAEQLKLKHRLNEYPSAGDGSSVMHHLADDELFLSFLKKTMNTDPELELILTRIRRSLLLDSLNLAPLSKQRLSSAMLCQCFYNEYVFVMDDEEKKRLEELEILIKEHLDTSLPPAAALEHNLLLYGMYFPLYTLPYSHALADVPLDSWAPDFQPVLQLTLLDYFEEEEIKKSIESIGEITDTTSKKVRSQYEENPYPRWLFDPGSQEVDMRLKLSQDFFHFTPPAFLNGHIRLLVAGCGTGKQPITYASFTKNADILAVDLSRSSLAYAIRMSRRTGIRNIKFAQADILHLHNLSEKFHVIACSGVLHHMEVPSDGLKILLDLLLPGGLINIGLYSEKAREAINQTRDIISKRGLEPKEDVIRTFRHDMLTSKDTDQLNTWLTDYSRDFFSMSECRDLLFHVKERSFTLPGIKKLIESNGLEFIGFEFEDIRVRQMYRVEVPEDPSMTDLLLWDKFEERHHKTFLGMYQLWCRKPTGLNPD